MKDLVTVISKGMAVINEHNPKNSVDFLVKWLLNYSQFEQVQEERQDSLTAVEQHIVKYVDMGKLHKGKHNIQEVIVFCVNFTQAAHWISWLIY